MKIIVAIAALVGSFVLGQTVTTSSMVQKVSKISLVAGDRMVCGINPSSYSVASNKAIIDYTVPSSHTLLGNLILSAQQK